MNTDGEAVTAMSIFRAGGFIQKFGPLDMCAIFVSLLFTPLIFLFMCPFLRKNSQRLSTIVAHICPFVNCNVVKYSIEVRWGGYHVTTISVESVSVSCISVGCAKGHYIDRTKKICRKCQPNFYQDEESQTSCKPCPQNPQNAGVYGAASEEECSGNFLCKKKELFLLWNGFSFTEQGR